MANLWKAVKQNGYEPGDFILISTNGKDVAVSGNCEFWDDDGTMPSIQQDDGYLIVEIIGFVEAVASTEHVHTFIETSRESEVLPSFAANYPVLGRFLGVIVHSTCDCGAVTSEWHSEAIEGE